MRLWQKSVVPFPDICTGWPGGYRVGSGYVNTDMFRSLHVFGTPLELSPSYTMQYGWLSKSLISQRIIHFFIWMGNSLEHLQRKWVFSKLFMRDDFRVDRRLTASVAEHSFMQEGLTVWSTASFLSITSNLMFGFTQRRCTIQAHSWNNEWSNTPSYASFIPLGAHNCIRCIADNGTTTRKPQGFG